MSEYSQKTIEYFFKKYNVKNDNLKAKLLTEITDIIYDYNMHIVKYEKEPDDYKRNQIAAGIKELENKIDDIFKNSQK
jgi:hypothetical protein